MSTELTSTTPTYHAKRSPSGIDGWMNCASWKSNPEGSSYADWGTDAHHFAADALLSGNDAEFYAGMVGLKGYVCDDDMVECNQKYIDYVRSLPGRLYVEQPVPIDHITGETDATGTSDAIVINGSEIIVCDLKTGMGVEVDAENNGQLQMYALGAYEQFGLAYDFKTVRVVIIQPRINHISEWSLSVDELLAFGERVRNATPPEYGPGEKQCRWCMNKPTCPAIQTEVISAFEVVPSANVEALRLGELMDKVPLIESWCKAIRAEIDARLLSGKEVPGYKVVQGKRGNRAWSSDSEVISIFKSMRLKEAEMYDFKLISPTKAERLLADQPKRWARVSSLITQSEGSPSVAPISDKRPALRLGAAADDFEVLPSPADLV